MIFFANIQSKRYFCKKFNIAIYGDKKSYRDSLFGRVRTY